MDDRQYTRDEIDLNLQTSQKWLERGVLAIFNFQTRDEQAAEETQVRNRVGFSGSDARLGTYYAKWLMSGKHLSGRHLLLARKIMRKYSGQLTRIANGSLVNPFYCNLTRRDSMIFTDTAVASLKTRLQLALDVVAAEEGISLKMGSSRYDEKNIIFQMNAGTVNGDGTVNTREREDFKHYAPVRYGLKAEALDKEFMFRGQYFTIYGCKPRNRKFPILAKGSEGIMYKFRPVDVKSSLTDETLFTT